ncbi:hypothetical protein AYI68_g3324, partial [Smittium mucronatum]
MDSSKNKTIKNPETETNSSESIRNSSLSQDPTNELNSLLRKTSGKSDEKQVDRLVLQYLRSKGYSDAEKVFKREAKFVSSRSSNLENSKKAIGNDDLDLTSDSEYYEEISDEEPPKVEVYVDISKDKNSQESKNDENNNSDSTISLESLRGVLEKRPETESIGSGIEAIKNKKIKVADLVAKELENISVEGNDVSHIVDLFKNKKSSRAKSYSSGFSKLTRWIDNSLEIYKDNPSSEKSTTQVDSKLLNKEFEQIKAPDTDSPSIQDVPLPP